MSDSAFLATLRAVVGDTAVLTDAAEMAGYAIDWRKLFPGKPLAVVRPKTTAEVADVLKACRAAGVAIVPQSGNTGMAGGAAPDASGRQIVISLSRMNAIRAVDPGAPFRWLVSGWGDFRATGFRGAVYGAVFALMGSLIALIYATRWQFTMGLTAGFFLIGPFVCTGLYDLSRQRARGQSPSLAASLVCWRRNTGGVALFAAIVCFAMIVWARVSVVIFALFSSTDFPDLKGFIAQR